MCSNRLPPNQYMTKVLIRTLIPGAGQVGCWWRCFGHLCRLHPERKVRPLIGSSPFVLQLHPINNLWKLLIYMYTLLFRSWPGRRKVPADHVPFFLLLSTFYLLPSTFYLLPSTLASCLARVFDPHFSSL